MNYCEAINTIVPVQCDLRLALVLILAMFILSIFFQMVEIKKKRKKKYKPSWSDELL